MSAQSPFVVPQRPDALQQRGLGGLAYWGDRKPPKNFSDVFRAYAATETTGEGADVQTRNVATLRLYGPIYDGWYGISARNVSAALDELGDVDEIRVRVNSPGGDAWEGMAILNMLRAHSAEIVGVVDGVAASAASYLVAGCDRTVMSPGTQMMIHDASVFAYGPADVMAKAKVFLDSVSDAIASIYADIAGGSDEHWRALMKETTWYTAKQAVESGLADSVGVIKDAGETDTAEDDEPPVLDDSEVEDMTQWVSSVFNTAGNVPAPNPPSASAVGSTHTEGSPAVAFSDEQLKTLRNKLGTAEDADEATILAALDEVLDEQAEPTPQNSAQVPEGHVVIPAAQLADLQAGAALATKTAQDLHESGRKTFLDSVRNKFLPANREAWEKEYDRDPVACRAHFAEAPVLIPTTELGHDNPVDEAKSEGDAVYATLFGDDEKAS